MNELDLLQEGLGNGTYYVVAENTDGRTSANSNEVEVDDIMPSVSVTKLHILDDGALQVYITAKDCEVGTKIKAFITTAPKATISEYAPSVDGSETTIVTQSTPTLNTLVAITESSYVFRGGLGGSQLAIWVFNYKITGGSSPYTELASAYVTVDQIKGLLDNPEVLDSFSSLISTYDKTTNEVSAKLNNSKYATMTDSPATLNGWNGEGSQGTVPSGGSYEPTQIGPEQAVSTLKYVNPITTISNFRFSLNLLKTRGFGYAVGWGGSEYLLNKFMFYMLVNGAAIINGRNGVFISEPLAVDPTLDPPVLTYATSNRKLQWEDVEGATSYAVYKDGEKVGTVTDGHFTPEPAAVAMLKQKAEKLEQIAQLDTRPVYDTDKNIVGYVTPEGKFKKTLKEN